MHKREQQQFFGFSRATLSLCEWSAFRRFLVSVATANTPHSSSNDFSSVEFVLNRTSKASSSSFCPRSRNCGALWRVFSFSITWLVNHFLTGNGWFQKGNSTVDSAIPVWKGSGTNSDENCWVPVLERRGGLGPNPTAVVALRDCPAKGKDNNKGRKKKKKRSQQSSPV